MTAVCDSEMSKVAAHKTIDGCGEYLTNCCTVDGC